jgi:flagellar basal-body rod protein FlgB
VKLFDATLDTLQRSLDARLLRHNVLAGNVANADTPGFVARDVDFAKAMAAAPAAAPAAARPGDLPLGPPAGAPQAAIVAAADVSPGLDGNGVDVDRALAAVAENAIQYGAAARATQKKLAMLRYAASDGNA